MPGPLPKPLLLFDVAVAPALQFIHYGLKPPRRNALHSSQHRRRAATPHPKKARRPPYHPLSRPPTPAATPRSAVLYHASPHSWAWAARTPSATHPLLLRRRRQRQAAGRAGRYSRGRQWISGGGGQWRQGFFCKKTKRFSSLPHIICRIAG